MIFPKGLSIAQHTNINIEWYCGDVNMTKSIIVCKSTAHDINVTTRANIIAISQDELT